MSGQVGTIKMELGKFCFVGEDENWYGIHLWIKGDRLYISNITHTQEFSVKGELMYVASIPLKSSV